MNLVSKLCLSIIIILLVFSLYNDLKKESISNDENLDVFVISGYQVAKIKYERGDTILSISERLNENNFSQISVEKIIADFLQVNPGTELHSLEVGKYYYFPIYEKN